jgi:hypothetical protein
MKDVDQQLVEDQIIAESSTLEQAQDATDSGFCPTSGLLTHRLNISMPFFMSTKGRFLESGGENTESNLMAGEQIARISTVLQPCPEGA